MRYFCPSAIFGYLGGQIRLCFCLSMPSWAWASKGNIPTDQRNTHPQKGVTGDVLGGKSRTTKKISMKGVAL